MIGDILQPTHLILLLLVALLVLGPKRLPEAGKSLGKGLRDFRNAMSGIEEHTANLFTPDEPSDEPPLVNEPDTNHTAPTVVSTSSAAPEPTVVASSSRKLDPADNAD